MIQTAIENNIEYPVKINEQAYIDGKLYSRTIYDIYTPSYLTSTGDTRVELKERDPSVPTLDEIVKKQEGVDAVKWQCPHCYVYFKTKDNVKKHMNTRTAYVPACAVRRRELPMQDGKWPESQRKIQKVQFI